MLREIKFIVVHCTQTCREVDADMIRSAIRAEGRRSMFHGIIDRDGHFMRMMGCNLIADNKIGNEKCYHLAYVGGIDRHDHPADTRTTSQHHALFCKIEELRELFPGAKVVGADHFTDREEENPCFDVWEWMGFYEANREDLLDIDVPSEEENEDGGEAKLWRSAS